MPSQPSSYPSRSVFDLLDLGIILGLVSAGMWFAWLGWDHDYYLVDGVAQGPYRPWQVIGCGAAVTLATVLVRRRTANRAACLLLPLAATVGFAIPWSVDASATDPTGLWGVGLVLILMGGVPGLALVVTLTAPHRPVTGEPGPGAPGRAS